jgi:hypothetical protein
MRKVRLHLARLMFLLVVCLALFGSTAASAADTAKDSKAAKPKLFVYKPDGGKKSGDPNFIKLLSDDCSGSCYPSRGDCVGQCQCSGSLACCTAGCNFCCS